MPLDNFVSELKETVKQLQESGAAKGAEQVVVRVQKPRSDKGPRFYLDGYGDREFIRMNSNSYLGLGLRDDMLSAEEEGAKRYGVGPGAVRFISGSYDAHTKLEQKLAAFHKREACMITSSAYTSALGVISTLAGPDTIIVSDELNHNCIINAMKLARPKGKKIYPHNDMAALEAAIKECDGQCDNLIVISDGVFSMRGDYAPLDQMADLCRKYNDLFARDIVLVVDDSHGVGALGETGRGTEELTGAQGIDIIVATLGKAFGVNGGYIVSDQAVIDYLREKNSFYIYTNPITPSEATASIKAVDILESKEGATLLTRLRSLTTRFEKGIVDLGYETIHSEHPVVPLMVRDTAKTTKLVNYLRDNDVLATGLNFPVVPKGDQLIRFQVSAEHTEFDIDYVLKVLADFKQA
jgi:glycine C-acetyltransferase